MSRSLGRTARIKAANRESGYEADGRRLFESGQPCPPRPSDRGKKYAEWRGWQRAAAAARTKKSKGKA